MLQRIEQGAVMLIVVVRMRLGQRLADDDGSRLGCLCLGRAAAVPAREVRTATAARVRFTNTEYSLNAGILRPADGDVPGKRGREKDCWSRENAGGRGGGWRVNWEGPLAWRFTFRTR